MITKHKIPWTQSVYPHNTTHSSLTHKTLSTEDKIEVCRCHTAILTHPERKADNTQTSGRRAEWRSGACTYTSRHTPHHAGAPRRLKEAPCACWCACVIICQVFTRGLGGPRSGRSRNSQGLIGVKVRGLPVLSRKRGRVGGGMCGKRARAVPQLMTHTT